MIIRATTKETTTTKTTKSAKNDNAYRNEMANKELSDCN